MIAFKVADMTCGHCASAITKALKAADRDAKVYVDVAQHLVTVESSNVTADELRDAIADIGYAPALAEASASESGPVRAGSCCGCR